MTPTRPDYDPNHPHGWTTRDGLPVRVWRTDAPGPFPIIGYIGHNNRPSSWAANGRVNLAVDDRNDLIDGPALEGGEHDR